MRLPLSFFLISFFISLGIGLWNHVLPPLIAFVDKKQFMTDGFFSWGRKKFCRPPCVINVNISLWSSQGRVIREKKSTLIKCTGDTTYQNYVRFWYAEMLEEASYNLWNFPAVDTNFNSFHQYLEYCHKDGSGPCFYSMINNLIVCHYCAHCGHYGDH